MHCPKHTIIKATRVHDMTAKVWIANGGDEKEGTMSSSTHALFLRGPRGLPLSERGFLGFFAAVPKTLISMPGTVALWKTKESGDGIVDTRDDDGNGDDDEEVDIGELARLTGDTEIGDEMADDAICTAFSCDAERAATSCGVKRRKNVAPLSQA